MVYMSTGMFRGKKSSNRIELSRLVEELLNFGVFGFLWLLGVGGEWMGVGVVGEVPPHTYTCMHMHMHGHACMVNMIISCKWLPPLGESLGIPYDVIRMCMHMCACMCMHMHVKMCEGHPPTSPHPHPPIPNPQRGTPRIIQNSIALELIEIFQFCLKI